MVSATIKPKIDPHTPQLRGEGKQRTGANTMVLMRECLVLAESREMGGGRKSLHENGFVYRTSSSDQLGGESPGTLPSTPTSSLYVSSFPLTFKQPGELAGPLVPAQIAQRRIALNPTLACYWCPNLPLREEE